MSFDGQNLSYVPIGSLGNSTIYGADISAYAGQTGQLLFTALPNGGGLIDNIVFPPAPFPSRALARCSCAERLRSE